MKNRVHGLVVRVTGHEVWVDVDGRLIPSLLRGRFRQKSRAIQVVAGDHVELSLPDATGEQASIEALEPRQTWLSRNTGGRDPVEKVIVANIDTLIVVVSLKSPKLNLAFLDRVLVSAERGHNHVAICINKIDMLDRDEDIAQSIAVYETVGYRIIRVSAKTGEGIDEVEALLSGGIYAFVGQSGVGKSSLLNRIDDSLKLKVSNVAHKTGRGRHTTTYSQLFPMKGGYVADTPGMQTFGFPGNDSAELAECFPEFRGRVDQCRFQPCTHSHEPDCAVKQGLADGDIAQSRYESYLGMLEEIEPRTRPKY